jgi:hypothetical protein
MENSLSSVTLVTLEQKKNIQQKGDAYNEKNDDFCHARFYSYSHDAGKRLSRGAG